MPKLARFNPPANLPDPNAGAWSTVVKGFLAPYLDGSLPQFYDPTAKDTPAGAEAPMVTWASFPRTLRATVPAPQRRWKLADEDRHLQDEYCEWAVTRNAARKITRVTFTTELPEYWEHLFETAPDRLLLLYRKLVDPRVEPGHLRTSNGNYRPENRWNRGARLAHLIQSSNKLTAAVDLVARATVQRTHDGRPVTSRRALVKCADLGEPLRNSDPQIASAVNAETRQGAEITLADPVGLYLGAPLTAGMVTPDSADAARFWKIERGDAEHTLRARFEVPPSRGYVVGDIKLGGRPIEFGAQVADRVPVWVKVVVKPGQHRPKPQPCIRPL